MALFKIIDTVSNDDGSTTDYTWTGEATDREHAQEIYLDWVYEAWPRVTGELRIVCLGVAS